MYHEICYILIVKRDTYMSLSRGVSGRERQRERGREEERKKTRARERVTERRERERTGERDTQKSQSERDGEIAECKIYISTENGQKRNSRET